MTIRFREGDLSLLYFMSNITVKFKVFPNSNIGPNDTKHEDNAVIILYTRQHEAR